MHTLSKRAFLGLMAASLFACSMSCRAEGKGSADEAVALVKKAVDFLKKNGKDKALAEISNSHGQFVDRDLYIFVVDDKGKMLAHGMLAKIIGKDVTDMKDADGVLIIKDMFEITRSKGSGWVHYKWPNPVTRNIDAKSTYVEKVDDMIVGCGIYK